MLLQYQYNDAVETKRWKKVLAFLLVFTIVFGALINLLSHTAMAQERLEVNALLSDFTEEIIDTSNVAAIDKDAMAEDSNIIALQNRDGSNTAYIFSEPVAFQAEDGSFYAKSTALKKAKDKSLREEGFRYENGLNDLRLEFSESPEIGVRVSSGDWAYTISPLGGDEQVVGEKTGIFHMDEELDAFQYPEYYGKGSALNFYPELNGVKEEIVLEEVPEIATYEFSLTTTKAKVLLNEEGTLSITDEESGMVVQTIRVPFAYDAEYLGDDPEDLTHFSPARFELSQPKEVREETLEYTLSIVVDEKWLTAETTVYPVTIDPTTSTLSNFYDAGVYSAKATTNYGTAETACFGRASAYGYGRVLLAFNLPSDVTTSTTINSAYYWLRETTGRTTTTYVTPYMATNVWLQSTVTWNKKPGYNSSLPQQTRCINGASTDMSGSSHWYRFNIQSAVNAWKNGTQTNRGLEFISNEESNGAYNWRAFACKEHSTSSYRPYAVVTYTNDTTPPTYTNITGNATNWTNQNVTLTVNGAADAGSGLASEAYSFSNSSTTDYWQSSNQKTFSSNQTVYIKIRDTVGNVKDCGSVAITKIDKTKPVISSVAGAPTAWTTSPYTLTVLASDDASGISEYSFTTSSSPSAWQTSNTKQLSESGSIYVFVKDGAGNISDATVLANVKFDVDAPVIDEIQTAESSQGGMVHVNVIAHDDGSGIAGYRFNSDGTWQTSNSFEVSVDDYPYSCFYVKDALGNITNSEAAQDGIMFYMDGQLVGLGNPANGFDGMEYKIGDNGAWQTYTWPFAIPAFTTTRIYARNTDGTGTVYSKDFTSLSKYYGAYSESNTDFSLAYRGLNFDYVRSYDSADYGWFFSTDATVKQLTSSIYSATLPDGTEESFIRNGQWTYINQRTEDVLEIEKDDVLEPTEYSVKVGDITYRYSLEGRLTCITNSYGDEITLSWTKRSGSNTGTLADYSSVDVHDGTSNGTRHYTVAINTSGKVTSVTDPENNTITYTYDTNGNLVKVVDQAGVTIGNYSYASVGSGKYRMTKSMDKTIQYNSAGRVIKELYDSGAYTNYTYDDANKTISTASSNTETTSTTYNDAFFVMATTDESGETSEYTYNDLYQVVSETVGNKTTTYTYDSSGDLTKTVDEDGKQTVYTYNSAKQIVKEVSEDGTTYYVYYDENESGGAEGDLKLSATLKKSYTGTAPTSYDSTLNCFETITYIYDNGLITRSIDNLNNETTEYLYDAYGNSVRTSVVKVTTDADGNQTSSLTVSNSTYDLFNRTLSTATAVDSENTETAETVYDKAGRTLRSNIKGDVTRMLYDSFGRVIQEIGPEDYDAMKDGLPNANTYSDSSAGATYVYAANNTLSSETNRLGKTTNYYYNSSGNRIREEFDIYKFYYRDHGELTEVKVNDVTKVTYNYNASTDLLESVIYANGDTEYYTYTSEKNVYSRRWNGDSAFITYGYNADHELTTATNSELGLYYDYGSTGNGLSIMRYDDDFVIQDYSESSNEDEVDAEEDVVTTINEHRYGTNCVSQVTNQSLTTKVGLLSPVKYHFTNNAKDNLESERVSIGDASNAYTTAYTYDADDNVTNKQFSLSNGTVVNIGNTYDSKKRITSTGMGNGTQSYSYDQYGQLTQTADTENGFVESYTYDTRGNILSKTKVYDDENIPAETTSFTYGNSAWQDELTNINGTSLTYDASGNVLTYGTKTFTWGKGRQLKQIAQGSNTYSYLYDQDGIRFSKTVNGTTTTYTTKDGVILAETTGGNTMFFQYDNFGNPYGFVRYNTQYLYLTNQMGDVIGITDTAGNLIATYSYGAWGEVLAVTPATAGNATQLSIANDNPLRYRGYYYDKETSYYYLQSRYYDPEICRFINADYLDVTQITKDTPAGQNLYCYCVNNPICFEDSSGAITLANAVGALIGLIAGIIGGYAIANWLANRLSLGGKKRKAFIGGVTAVIGVSGAAIGYVVGAYASKLAGKVSNYVVPLIVNSGKLTLSRIPAVVRNKLGIISKVVNYLIKNASKLKYSRTAAKHLSTRPYMNSTQLLKEIMRSKTPILDRSLKNGLKWVVKGSFNGRKGTWELVIDLTKQTIVHFLFKKG